MELPKRGDRSYRTPGGKRLRTPEEFIALCEEKGHPVSQVKIYNRKDKIVIEALKNMKTKHTHILKVRKPTNVEENEYGSLLTREQILTGQANKDQIELIVGGADYKKQPLKSR